MTDTSILLGLYADLINQYGVGSVQAKKFLDEHRENKELVELCQTANFLRTNLDRYQARTQNARRGR
jgi:hypothetical protein